MGINFSLRQLEYAVAVGRHLSFRDAAAACHVSQPSLSTQIQTLESIVGDKIFERSARMVSVTDFGRGFLEGAARVLDAATELNDLARSEREPLSGPLRVGIIPTIAPYLLPGVVRAVREQYPDCRLQCFEGRTANLLEQLKANDLDLLLLALEADLSGVDTMALFHDPFLAAIPDGHELAGRKEVALEDLPLEELLLLEEGHCLADQVRSLCGTVRRGGSFDVRASSLVTLAELVALGEGVTLVPGLARQPLEAITELGFVELDPPAHRTVGFAYRSGSPRRKEFELFGDLVEGVASRQGGAS